MKMNMQLVFYIAAGLLMSSSGIAQTIRGVPGVDYPNYESIPKTSFKCSEQKYIPGFYADLETECQVFHFCYKHRGESFLCPPGTTFNQAILACDSWYNSNCSLASLFYVVNAGPGMREAGKNIPMLLKLRDRAQSSTVVKQPISPDQPELAEREGDKEVLSAEGQNAIPESAKIEESGAEAVQNQSNEVESKNTNAVENVQNFDADRVVEEEVPKAEDQENEKVPLDFNENVVGFDQFDTEPKENLVYDPVPNDFMDDFHPEAEWKDETEEMSDKFQDFYNFDFNTQMMEDSEPHHFPEQDEDTGSLEESDTSFTENLSDYQGEINEMDEFSKRLLHTSRMPKRTRRRPTYVVLDKPPKFGHSRFQSIPEPPESESPFTESISMDTLVELNTELPDDYSLVNDEENYGEYNSQGIGDFATNSEEAFLDPAYDSELQGLETVEYDESDSYMNTQDESDQYEIDQQTSEFVESDADFEEDYALYNYERRAPVSVDDLENDVSDEDIVVYDDSDGSSEPDFDSEYSKSDSEEKFVVIPDETDFPIGDATSSTSDDSEDFADGFESDRSENPFELGETPDEDENIYVYDDRVENEQEYPSEEIQSEIPEGQAYYDPQTGGNYGSYETSEGMSQNDYNYRTLPAGMDYSQFEGQEYNFDQYQRYSPGYYQYVDEYGRPLGPEFGNPEIQDPSFGGLDISGQRGYSEPDNLYEHGVFGDSDVYENVPQGNQQAEFANQYSYNSKLGYYQSLDGTIYSSEGEILNPSVAHDTEDASLNEFLDPEMQYAGSQEQDPPNEFNYAEGESDPEMQYAGSQEQDSPNEFNYAEGESDPEDMFSDSEDYSDQSSDGTQTETYEDFDVTESGLVEDTGEEQKDEETFFVIDEETDPAEDDFEGTEESEYPDSNSELPEEVIAEDVSSTKQNDSESLRPVNDTESGSEILSVTEEGNKSSAADSEQSKEKMGRKSEIPVNNWSGQSFAMDMMNLAPVSSIPKQFNSANVQPELLAPTETRFLNSMTFQNPMDFGPYGFGPNMGQISMLDSSNAAPFSKGQVPEKPAKSDKSKLSKLSSFQDRVRSMKRGKFGMFKKYMKSMKDE